MVVPFASAAVTLFHPCSQNLGSPFCSGTATDPVWDQGSEGFGGDVMRELGEEGEFVSTQVVSWSLHSGRTGL
jgi:hypothetical protein